MKELTPHWAIFMNIFLHDKGSFGITSSNIAALASCDQRIWEKDCHRGFETIANAGDSS